MSEYLAIPLEFNTMEPVCTLTLSVIALSLVLGVLEWVAIGRSKKGLEEVTEPCKCICNKEGVIVYVEDTVNTSHLDFQDNVKRHLRG